MRIVTFNVNGLRSINEYYFVSKGWNFDQFLDSLNADIICFQETKINDISMIDRDMALPGKYTAYYASQRAAKKIGYSGVVTFCKNGWLPMAYEEGFTGILSVGRLNNFSNLNYSEDTLKILDSEGRCIITDHGHFILLNVYFPNDSGPERFEYREKFYNIIWDRCISFLNSGRSIIIAGDINVCLHPRDHCDYSPILKKIIDRKGITIFESVLDNYMRDSLNGDEDEECKLLIDTFYGEKPLRRWFYHKLYYDPTTLPHRIRDVFRELYPNEYNKYTCWNTLVSARGTNHGTRIDNIIVGGPLFEGNIKDCLIMSDFMGSDHCPILMEVDLEPFPSDSFVEPANLKKFRSQKKLSDFFTKKSDLRDSFVSPTINDHSSKRSKINNDAKEKLNLMDYFGVVPKKSLSPQLASEVEVTSDNLEDSNSKWKDIFMKPKPAPLCKKHQEPCKLLTVNKNGPNKGRKFYICSKGVGDQFNPEARCDHFEWYSQPKK